MCEFLEKLESKFHKQFLTELSHGTTILNKISQFGQRSNTMVATSEHNHFSLEKTGYSYDIPIPAITFSKLDIFKHFNRVPSSTKLHGTKPLLSH